MALAPRRFKPSRLPGVTRLDQVVGAASGKARPVERRGSAHERGYGHRWQVSSKGYLRRHPLCVCCLANGITASATLVDHVRPHRGDMALFWDATNWQALCKRCHDVVKQAVEHAWDSGLLDAALLRLDRLMPQHFPTQY